MNTEIIKEINRIFHEEEAKFYDQRHPEIIQETNNWINFCEIYLKKMTSPIIVLDIGTGTGFVPSILTKYLKTEDKIISTDISQKMLDIAKEKLKNSICRSEFIKMDSEDLSLFKDSSIDLITVNSVLHHLPNYPRFLKETDRILKSSGIICIMHEPNKLFFNNLVLFPFFRLLSALMSKFGKLRKNKNKKEKNSLLLKNVNQRMVKEKIIEREIDIKDIQPLVDIWSPTAYSKINKNLGFDIAETKKEIFPDYRLLSLKTYNYLCKINISHNLFFRSLEKIFSLIFPKSGSSFCLVIQKP